MRTKAGFRDLDDVNVLYRYLYAKEDRSVIVENAIGTRLEIFCDAELDFKVRYPDIDKSDQAVQSFNSQMYPNSVLGIIDQLKEKPSDIAGSQWNEIKALVAPESAVNTIYPRNAHKSSSW